jgi:ribose transport system substrate-binding protein
MLSSALRRVPRTRFIVAAAALAVFAAGCGSSSSQKDASTARVTGSASTAQVATAKADMAPYVGKASAFPVNTPLTKHLPAGSTLAYLQCPTATCALAGKAVAGAAKTLGLTYHPVSAGVSSTDETTALNSIIALKPKLVIIPGLNPAPFCSQIKQLVTEGVGVGTFGMVGAQACGVKAAINGGASAALGGQLMADWVVATEGAKANVAMYVSSELAFSPDVQHGFTSQMKKLCSSCSVRIVQIPLSAYGSSAPSMMVGDLQRNPSTNTMVFDNEESAIGLPAALKTADLSHENEIGWGPEPANLSDIQSGAITAGIGVDIPTMIWETVDAATRVGTGQPLPASEQGGVPPVEVLEKQNITFHPADGFSPYPNFAERFAKLWGVH